MPKTIDNDLESTTLTFGFNTAVFAADCIDWHHSTALSHQRVIVVEVIAAHLYWKHPEGKPYSIVVVAEGDME